LLQAFHRHCEHIRFAQRKLREAFSLSVIPSEARNPTLSVVLSVSEGSQDKSGDTSVALLLQDDAMRQIASSLRFSQ